jgi:hypothetical protein
MIAPLCASQGQERRESWGTLVRGQMEVEGGEAKGPLLPAHAERCSSMAAARNLRVSDNETDLSGGDGGDQGPLIPRPCRAQVSHWASLTDYLPLVLSAVHGELLVLRVDREH